MPTTTPASNAFYPRSDRRTPRGTPLATDGKRLFTASPFTWIAASAALGLFFAPHLDQFWELHQHHLGTLQLWRLFTCHLLHWSREHLFWDVAMFVVLGTMCERRATTRYAAVLTSAALAIPLICLSAQPTVESYRGLSGLDTALFCLLSTSLLAEHAHSGDRRQAFIFAMLLLALGCKLIFEFYSGSTLFVHQSEFVPLPIAHLVGGLIGCAGGIELRKSE